jgi:hypothetical protein
VLVTPPIFQGMAEFGIRTRVESRVEAGKLAGTWRFKSFSLGIIIYMSQKTHEIRLSPNIGAHDIAHKAKKAQEFIEDNGKIKLSLSMKGRNIKFTDRAMNVVKIFAETLGDIAEFEKQPKQDGRRITAILRPKSKKR